MRYIRLPFVVAIVAAVLAIADGNVDTALASSPDFGNGSDGAITFSSSTRFNPPGDAMVVSGSLGGTTLTVSGPSGVFQAGQKILIHQTRGTGAGTWEMNQVQSYALGNVVTTTPLAATYSTSGATAAQVLAIPQYTNVTISPGVTVEAKPWNGATGGILAFLANGTVTIAGAVNAIPLYNLSGSAGSYGAGYHGGSQPPFFPYGNTGEGTAGASVQSQKTANGSGGGGGEGGDTSGGGGGGNGTAGNAGVTHNSTTGGAGGASAGTADLATMVFGGGGGSGNGNAPAGGAGGGGGIIFIAAANISSTGSINANGANGNAGGGSGSSGGGGGAGGSILLRVQSATFGSSLIIASGGVGGAGQGSGTSGGAGGTGRIRVEYCTTISGGIADPPASVAQISCDSDGDGVADATDNCPSVPNSGQQNLVHPGTYAGDHCEDPEPDGVFDFFDRCPDVANPGQQNSVHSSTFAGDNCEDPEPDGVFDITDNCPDAPNALQENADGDPYGDACETAPCVGVPNAWTTPTGDDDCDGFPDTVTTAGRGREDFIGTDATDRCADTTAFNDETAPGESPWPPDFNDNRAANLSDVVMFGASFNQIGPNPPNPLYNARFDLNASNSVNLSDVVAIGPFFNKFCTP